MPAIAACGSSMRTSIMTGPVCLLRITPAITRAAVLAAALSCPAGVPATLPIAAPVPVPSGVAPQVLERQVKAAFLLKFTNFIQWPAGTAGDDRPLVIGVLDAEDVAAYLDRLSEDRPPGARPITVRRVEAEEADEVQLLYIDPGLGARTPSLLQQLAGRPIVTVTATRDSNATGIINFVTENRRVHFDIDLTAARRAGVKISARLLRVARTVYEEAS